MAANINMVNGRASMFFYGEKPWHKLGQELDHPATAFEAIQAAGLDYTVTKNPLLATTAGLNGLIEVPEQYATVRTDTWDVLGIVGEDYEIVQNSDAFSFFDSLVGTGEAMYHTAGALGKGERIWIMAKLPDTIRINGTDDIIDEYLLLTTGHNGKYKVRAKLTPVRVVCNNTLTAALQGAGAEVTITHTKNVHTELSHAHKLLNLSKVQYKALGEVYNQLALKQISSTDLLTYCKSLIPDNTEPKANNKQREEKRSQIINLFSSGIGAGMNSGTLWNAYNAVTEFVDHVQTKEKDDDGKLKHIWFGDGDALKSLALNNAVAML